MTNEEMIEKADQLAKLAHELQTKVALIQADLHMLQLINKIQEESK